MPDVVDWIDPTGVTVNLSNGTSRRVLWGREGFYMPPIAFVENEVPLQAGSRLRSVRVLPRELDVPVYIDEATVAALRTTVRSLLGSFNPLRGDGTLRVQGPSGDIRQLTCRYSKGLEGHEQAGPSGHTYQKLLLVFRAFDPYWYAPNAISASYAVAQSTASWFPIFPLRLAASSVFADDSVINGGDVEAWPVWTITGPGSAIYLRNLTTGQLINLNTTLAAGDVVTIDTRRGRKSVRTSAGVNLYGSLSSDSAMWSFGVGTTAIRIEMAGAIAGSAVAYSFYPAYLGA